MPTLIPPTLNYHDLLHWGRSSWQSKTANPNKAHPVLVSGNFPVKGIILKVETQCSAHELERSILSCTPKHDFVLVSDWAPPDWIPVLRKYSCKGILVKIGSMLSHPAALAREAHIPMVSNIVCPEDTKTGDSVDIQNTHFSWTTHTR